MECENCLKSYDHSKHMPFSFYPCSHMMCLNCLQTTNSLECFKCATRIDDVLPNYVCLTSIPRTNYEKLKQELDFSINNVNELKHKFDMRKELKLEELINRVIKLRKRIRTKANQMIEIINENKRKLVETTRHLESYFMRTLNEIQIDKHLFMKNHEIKMNLNRDIYTETDLELILAELEYKKATIDNKLNQIENFDDYYFIENDTLNLGELINSKWTLKEPITSRDFLDKGILIFKQLKDYERAVECFNKSLKNNQDKLNAAALNWKGVCLYELKQYKEAIECYDKAIEIEPKYSIAYCNKGAAYRELNEFELAINSLDKSLEINPDCHYTYFNKGLTYYYDKEFKEALEYLNKSSELKPTDACVWNWKGNCFKEMNDFKRAFNCYNKAIQLNPNYENAYLNKQVALKNLQPVSLD